MKNKVRSVKPQCKWYKTFWSIFSAYRETDNGSIRSINHNKSGKGNPVGAGHVKPNRSDFVADVETAAKSVLSRTQFQQFQTMRELRKVPEDVVFYDIAERCGAEFFRRGIHPLQVYFKEVYCVPARRKQ